MKLYNSESARVIGWDVGGAHLKAALLDAAGNINQVIQVPCALWKGLRLLEAAIDEVMQLLHQASSLEAQRANTFHVVTMTGELVDLFENRQFGVLEISRVMTEKLNGQVYFYRATHDGYEQFVSLSKVEQYWKQIASVNWHASACLIAQKIPLGLLIDMGSTTTDFVVLESGRPQCLGFSDAARLQSQELVYTGVVRTPLMAVAQNITFDEMSTSVAAEYFATMADVYRLTQELHLEDDMAETADGQDKTTLASARRIARMIGHDVEDATIAHWLDLANAFKTAQLNRLSDVALTHIARLLSVDHTFKTITIIGAGAGRFLLKQLATMLKTKLKLQNLNIEYIDSAELLLFSQNQYLATAPDVSIKAFDTTMMPKHWASICLPAVAVACLAQQNQT